MKPNRLPIHDLLPGTPGSRIRSVVMKKGSEEGAGHTHGLLCFSPTGDWLTSSGQVVDVEKIHSFYTMFGDDICRYAQMGPVWEESEPYHWTMDLQRSPFQFNDTEEDS